MKWLGNLWVLGALSVIAGCERDGGARLLEPSRKSVIWAVNVGGEAYRSSDGIAYAADEGIEGGTKGAVPEVKGSQDNPLYRTFRVGDIRIVKLVENGVYDLQFRFAEPLDHPAGERVFSVLAEGERVIQGLDVRSARDGKHASALDRVVPGIVIKDGQLDIAFQANNGEPLLNALVVRRRVKDTRNWKLIWSDEFDREGSVDPDKWTVEVWPARKVNDEDQAYTGRSKNVRVENGLLVLEAHRERYEKAAYTSGRIHSQGKGDFLYGKVEVRAKLPAGQGTWPAIWMLPSNPYKYATSCEEGDEWHGSETCDAWPNSGEIDIMEHVGYDMNTVHATVHNKAYYWLHWNQRKGSIDVKNVDTAFHVYVLEWTPNALTMSMDGSPFFTYVNDGSGWEAWPFDHPYHLVLNLAIGGMWGRGGGPIDASIFPVRLEIDYVRVFESSF